MNTGRGADNTTNDAAIKMRNGRSMQQSVRCIPGNCRLTLLLMLLQNVLLLLVATTCFAILVNAELEVKWTPAEEDGKGGSTGGGPLPLSMKQRQGLEQLEQAIRNSPDPEATLAQVASQQGLTPTELSQILVRNHQDMTSTSPTVARHSVGWNTAAAAAASSGASFLWRFAWVHHKRSSSLLLITVASLLYLALVVIPNTGWVWSEGPRRRFRTVGHSTLFSPPRHYIQEHFLTCSVQQQQFKRSGGGDETIEAVRKFLNTEATIATTSKNEVTWHALSKNQKLFRQAVTAQETVFLPKQPTAVRQSPVASSKRSSRSGRRGVPATVDNKKDPTSQRRNDDGKDSDNEDEEDETSEIAEIRQICLDHAARLLTARELTVFSDAKQSKKLSLIVEDDEDGSSERAVLVVPGMGDWGRYGILPLDISGPIEDDEDLALTMSVAPGGHWDGYIHISIVPAENEREVDRFAALGPDVDDSATSLAVVRVSIVVPIGGHAPTRRISSAIASGLAFSIAASLKTRTQVSAARLSQSRGYQSAAQGRAFRRRINRNHLEQQMEDMSVERRRRWQRKNPSGVSNYRPSGERMRSPIQASYR